MMTAMLYRLAAGRRVLTSKTDEIEGVQKKTLR